MSEQFRVWVDGLSDAEKLFLRRYKDNSENLKLLLYDLPQNPCLIMDGFTWNKTRLTQLDSAISKLSHPAGTTLWCAVPDGEHVNKYIVDGVYTYPAYISTSLSDSSSYKFFRSHTFSDPFLLKFDMTSNFVGAKLPLQIGVGDGEQEIVLPREKPFSVISGDQTIPLAQLCPHLKIKHPDKLVTVLHLRPI